MSIAFYEEVGRLKTLLRTGWVKRGIPDPESVADHTCVRNWPMTASGDCLGDSVLRSFCNERRSLVLS